MVFGVTGMSTPFAFCDVNRICGRPRPCDGTSIPKYGFMQDESMASYQSMASTDVMAITKWSI